MLRVELNSSVRVIGNQLRRRCSSSRIVYVWGSGESSAGSKIISIEPKRRCMSRVKVISLYGRSIFSPSIKLRISLSKIQRISRTRNCWSFYNHKHILLVIIRKNYYRTKTDFPGSIDIKECGMMCATSKNPGKVSSSRTKLPSWSWASKPALRSSSRAFLVSKVRVMTHLSWSRIRQILRDVERRLVTPTAASTSGGNETEDSAVEDAGVGCGVFGVALTEIHKS